MNAEARKVRLDAVDSAVKGDGRGPLHGASVTRNTLDEMLCEISVSPRLLDMRSLGWHS